MSLLQGPVVFIDDEVDDPAKPAWQLAQQIRDTGRPIATYRDLPSQGDIEHWRSMGFLVLDWDLVPGSPGGFGASTLSEFQRGSLFDWLSSFVHEVFCPVFIVSAEDVDDIKRQVGENAELAGLVASGRLEVFAKQTVMTGFVEYLERWVSSRPALAAMNIWANAHEAATNRLFLDMDELTPEWPAYVWRTAVVDGVDPSFELASVLSANLLHRIDTVRFDIPAISGFEGPVSGASMRRVSRGRTTIPGERLYPTMLLPGDLFDDEDDPGECVWVNVTPACHTVLNRVAKGRETPEPDMVRVHLVKGRKLEIPSSKSQMGGQKKDHDTSNGMLVHTLLDDHPYAFDFRTSTVSTWGEVKDRRVARLLPPFITLMQQKHASFLLNEGLPRVEWELYAGG